MSQVRMSTIVLGWEKKLASLDHLLGKASELAAQMGIGEAELLDWSLAPDMHPLRSQAQYACNLVRQWAERAAGLAAGRDIEGPCDIEELRTGVADVRSLLQGLEPSLIDGRDELLVTLDLVVVKPTMPLGQWVSGFAATNIIFHLSTFYAILRSRGAALGKADLFAGGL